MNASGSIVWLFVLALCLRAQTAQNPVPQPPAQPKPDRRAELNLLGRTDTEAGESRRNENVQFNLIDNNALKELNLRIGTTATIVNEFRADRNYFGAEFGNPPAGGLSAGTSPNAKLHGSFYWGHENSLLQARSFFQVGGVRPARENGFGGDVGFQPWRKGTLSFQGGLQIIRGNVNGNVLVPRANERSVLATDPAVRAVVLRYMNAYPAAAPNRTDINERALNTNSLQAIDDRTAGARLDQSVGGKDLLVLRYLFTEQIVGAFQFVAGQNPDTTTRAHTAQISWVRQVNPSSVLTTSMAFDRVTSLLAPEPNAADTALSIGGVLERLGPGSTIPIDRAQNRFRYASALEQQRGIHSWHLGGEIARRQVNGSEASSHRGTLTFRNEFDRDAMTNFRLGIPSRFSGAVGNVHRGFRLWEGKVYAGGNSRAMPGLTLHYGLRYEPVGRPTEVNGLTTIPYSCNCLNFAPRFGFAYRMPRRWGIIRSAYGMHFGEIYVVTFQQLRYNPPLNIKFELLEPYLPDVFSRLNVPADPNARSTIFDLSPNLKTPYTHHYNFSWELNLVSRWRLQLGYVGSRSHQLLMLWYTNRARVVDGIPQTTATVNGRRPDSTRFDVRRILNGSRAYFDAGRVSLLVPRWLGFNVEASYWFSKAIDLGAAYSNTGTGDDGRQTQSPSEFDIWKEMKGPSNFDGSHAFLLRASWSTPAVTGWKGRWLGSWEISGVGLAKTGTPFTVVTGSDAPGFGNVDGDNGDRPHLVDPSVLGRTIGHPDTSTRLLPTTAFRFIRPTELRGSLGSNTFRKAGVANVNASAARLFPLGNGRRMQLRIESVNLFNTPQFAEPTRELSSPSFGFITNTLNDGRTIRGMLRISF